MYGTVARMHLKPGMEQRMNELTELNQEVAPGFVGMYVYKMDNDPNEFYVVVMFESREAYIAYANSPGQEARFQEYAQMMDAEPQWHDGEIVWMSQ